MGSKMEKHPLTEKQKLSFWSGKFHVKVICRGNLKKAAELIASALQIDRGRVG